MKVLYVTTIASTMNFFPAHVKMLQEAGHTVELASNFSDREKCLKEPIQALSCMQHHIPFSRSPFSKDNLTAYKALKQLLEGNHYDIVHTHTPNASALVRLACRKLRKNGLRVFYTAHGFHFYSGAPRKNWLIYYPVEKFLSRWTDVLITINAEDYQRAKKSFHAKKTVYIPGVGMNTGGFCDPGYIRGKRRKEIGAPEDALLLLSVGELNENKNHQTVLKAMTKCSADIHYVICGFGDKKDALLAKAQELGIGERVHLMGVRRDISQWMTDADVYMFPSFREGLSVSLMEAMTSGLPVVCSDIRGNRDLIEKETGGILCPPGDPAAFAQAILRLKGSPELRRRMGEHNREAVEGFSTRRVLEELKKIYQI